MLSKLAVLFTVVAYANAQCGTGGTLQGSNCVCDTGYLCGGSVSTDWGCAADTSCSCESSSTPCTSFTTFPQANYNFYNSGDYKCISTTDTVYSTYTSSVCNVPTSTDSPGTYNSACATPCKSWSCTDYGSNSIYGGGSCTGTCYTSVTTDQCGASKALEAAAAIWITYVIVVIVIVVICCCIVPILACFFMGAACFNYRKNANPV